MVYLYQIINLFYKKGGNMVLVILVAGDHQHGVVETLLRHAEMEMVQPMKNESTPLSLSLETGGLLASPSPVLFKKKEDSPWQRGFSRDSRFKEKPLKQSVKRRCNFEQNNK
ncbi:MAG: hypothetical protein AAB497_01205 [Patescibacteria group bacterium]